MKVVISGGTGLIGSALAESFRADGYEVSIISRDPANVKQGYNAISWDEVSLLEGLSGSDVVINLAGASLAGDNPLKMRWTKTRKKRIIASRVDAGDKLVKVIRKLEQKPKVFIQASAIGFYGNDGYNRADENSQAGSDFLAEVCQKWEDSTTEIEEYGVRRLVIRIGLVLSKSGGLFKLLSLPFRLFIGGRIGTGEQYLSWIHIEDIVNSIRYLIDDPQLQGVYNLSSPTPETNLVFSQLLGTRLGLPVWLPIPGPILKIVLGEASTLALDGRPVFPSKLVSAGYQFQYQDLDQCLIDLLNS
jgi:uncharacterized protein (TIGR01777 family)